MRKDQALYALKELSQYSLFIVLCVGCDMAFNLSKVKQWSQLFGNSLFLPAVVDNLSHGIIALYAWLLITEFKTSTQNIVYSILCLMIGCLIDIDHFVQAGSLHLKDAVTLPSRPMLHCTTILTVHIVLLALRLSTNGQFINKKTVDIIFITFIAILTHHLRDGQRRGLWLWPLGSTPLLDLPVYLFSMITLPWLLKIVRNKML